MPASPPFLGAPRVIRDFIGGDPGFVKKFFGHKFGINYYSQRKLSLSSLSLFDLFPKDTY